MVSGSDCRRLACLPPQDTGEMTGIRYGRILQVVDGIPYRPAWQESTTTIEISDFGSRESWQPVRGISRPLPARLPSAPASNAPASRSCGIVSYIQFYVALPMQWV